MKINISEFDGERAKLYEKAITEFPNARQMDIETMHRFLNPQKGERILGFGEGNGYFCRDIAKAVGPKGYYLVTDPSKDQLENLKKRINLSQLEIKVMSAEGLDVSLGFFDKVWSFGAFHHVSNQTEAMKKIYDSLRSGGTAVICDVFQGTDLSKHFDTQVARYCVTGHEVKFLSEEFARTLCYLAGFDENKVEIIDIPQKWMFYSEKEIGQFIHDLHAMTLMEGTEKERVNKTLEGCRKILGIEIKCGRYYLNWPMKAIKVVK